MKEKLMPAELYSTDSPVTLDEYEMERIHFHANQLSQIQYFCQDSIEDITSELLVAVYQALPSFDPTKSNRHTFVCRVLVMRRINLIRDAKQRFQETIPIEGPISDEIDRDVRHHMIGYVPVDAAAVAERIEAVGKAIESLSEQYAEVARLLMNHSQAEVASILGVSKAAIERARRQIYKHFAQIGIENLF